MTKKTAPKKNEITEIKMRLVDEKGKASVGEPLDELIVNNRTHPHLLHQAVVMVEANKRLGTAKVKTRAEVRGGGKKPWRQKGTGNARHGSSRSPIWRKGGVTFGPGEREYGFTLPKKMKAHALLAGIKAKARLGKFLVIDDLNVKEGKTKEMADWMKKLSLKKPLLIRESSSPLVNRSCRNIKKIKVTTSDHVAAFDVLSSDECVATRKGYEKLMNRLRSVTA